MVTKIELLELESLFNTYTKSVEFLKSFDCAGFKELCEDILFEHEYSPFAEAIKQGEEATLKFLKDN